MSTDFRHLRLLEALLFASPEPLGAAQLARHLPEQADLDSLLAELSRLYANRGVNLVQVGERWAFRTAADLAPMMRIERKSERKLSGAALETLAIVAYHQPVTRGEIEEIRGVALSKGTLDTLLEAGWVKPKGRRRTPGRPVTWGTTEAFLDHFGLENLDALPGVGDLKAAGLLDSRPAIATRGARSLLAEAAHSGADDAEEGDQRAEDPWDLLSSEFGEAPGGDHARAAEAGQGSGSAELPGSGPASGDES